MSDHDDGPVAGGRFELRLSLLVAVVAVTALVGVNVVIFTCAVWGTGARRKAEEPGRLAAAATTAESGRETYMVRCLWCHGNEGRGDGFSTVGMVPRPRDFVRAEYKIRSTPRGQLPTDDDLFSAIADGLAATPMPSWKEVLSEQEIRRLVSYLKSFSPRFATEQIEPLAIPGTVASVQRGQEIYAQARCFMCHGEAGRGDGGITATLDYQWGFPQRARDFTMGWTFKGGRDPRDIYLRITGGLNGTPMGPYQELLSDQDRWDLAHYVASLDREPSETSEDFVVTAALIDGEIPQTYGASQWKQAQPILIPLAGQVSVDPQSIWWAPTTGSAAIRALRNREEIGFLVEWNDPTGEGDAFSDSALLQFAANEGSRPYFVFGGPDDAVVVWRWQSDGPTEEWTAAGTGTLESLASKVQAYATWDAGRWHVVFKRPIVDEPDFEPGRFLSILLSIQDGANDELANVRAISTWFYVTVQRPGSLRPWLVGLACLLGLVIVEVWILAKPRS